jgi:hypothetical protein
LDDIAQFYANLERLPDTHAQIEMAREHFAHLPSSELARWLTHPVHMAWVHKRASDISLYLDSYMGDWRGVA